jgi:hypothetical protein
MESHLCKDTGKPIGSTVRGAHPARLGRVGDELRVEIRDVDPERRRVRLSPVPSLPTPKVLSDPPD